MEYLSVLGLKHQVLIFIPNFISANPCTPSLNVDNSASVQFVPPTPLMTGTYFVVICSPGYLPESIYGRVSCDGQGLWLNAPSCTQVEPTTHEMPSTIETTTSTTTTTTTQVIPGL